MDKRWDLAKPVDLEFKKKFPEIPGVILQLLFNRGIKTQEQIDNFLQPDYGQDLLDPFLFTDMEKIVNRIYQAVKNKEKITIHGDYDADGVTASSVLAKVLQKMGADFDVYLPHREKEGYGLNARTMKYLARQKTRLIITVDCGISNQDEISLANEKGMEVIVTDHHAEPLQLPPAYAIIDPQVKKCNYGFKSLAGAGVAFKLAQALIARDNKGIFPKGFEKWLLDLVAVGTVTDVMPLLGENRILVKFGLIVLNKSRNLGLKLLAQNAGVLPIDSQDLINSENIGFSLGPRLNAAGRMDHANAAYELLMAEKYDDAEKLAKALEISNQKRQQITDKLIEEIKKQLKNIEKQQIILAEGRNWPLGVIGIVAGRLKDEFNRPVIIMSKTGAKVVGSGRSIPELNLIAALNNFAHYFANYGGHAAAAGFTLKNKKLTADFSSKIADFVEKELKGKDLRPKLLIDAELDLQDLNWQLFDQIMQFEPFGEANPKPLFLVKNLKVENIKTVGKANNHLKLFLKQEKMIKGFDSIGFGMGDKIEHIKCNDKIDVVCEINLNEFNGSRSLELRLVDIKK